MIVTRQLPARRARLPRPVVVLTPTGHLRDQPRPARRAVRAALGARQHRRVRRRPRPGHAVRRVGGRGRRHDPARQSGRRGAVLGGHRTELTGDVGLRRRPLARGRRAFPARCSASDRRRRDRLADAPTAAVLAASKRVFDEVPVRTPGTLAFAPIVDGDVVPDYPVAVARAGRTHPVPLIIGTNKHEAALFRFMKSPLMPITPQAIKAMFAEIASEQPGLQLPTEAQLGATYRGRGKTPGMGVARDIGFRMPSIWFAEGHATVAPVYVYRFDLGDADAAAAAARRRARHRTALRVGQPASPGPRIRRSSWAGSRRAAPSPSACAPGGETSRWPASPPGRPATREWRPYRARRPRHAGDRQAGRRGGRPRPAAAGRMGRRRAQLPLSGALGSAVGGVDVDVTTWFLGVPRGRAAAADARPGDVRGPVLPAAADHRVGGGAQARHTSPIGATAPRPGPT